MNPVANFTSDNNGTIIRLPALPADGQATATGELVFGVGTRQNNVLPSTANVVPVDQTGFFTTIYMGKSFAQSAIDSGTGANFFQDGTIPVNKYSLMYIPSSALSLTAALKPSNGATTSVAASFQVGNAMNLMASQYAAFDSLGAYQTLSNYFVWGLPFFFGRSVYTVLEGAKIGTQTGPFVAF